MIERVLVICEKPSAARRIAEALDEDGKPRTYMESGVSFFTAHRGEAELTVVSALGHLFTVAQRGGKWTYPVFEMRWVPAHQILKSALKTKSHISIIERMSKDADRFVSACDYDMEGSLIAYNILLYVCGQESLKKSKRMKYSTLTDGDIVNAWDTASPTLDYPVIESGRARHEVDWLYGINLSRALTLSVKKATGLYNTLSIGRVQGPTLGFIEEREAQILTHVPLPYWIVEAETKIDGRRYLLEYAKQRIDTQSEAQKIELDCRGRDGSVVNIKTSTINIYPPPPFNLGDLQREAYQRLRCSPKTTLSVAEKLYLQALISYPRTSSQRLPPSIDLRYILRGLGRKKEYKAHANTLLSKPMLRPKNGEKDDPAHPAIHPTGNMPGKLSPLEYRIFDLICRRFMATLGDPGKRQVHKALIDLNSHDFHLNGSKILVPGWTQFYSPYFGKKENLLPLLREGQVIPISELDVPMRFSKPPPRLSPVSLLKIMEDENLGTKATRADIIDTLFKRGYVLGSQIEITELGFSIVETMKKYCPGILSVKTTKDLEADLEGIHVGERTADFVVKEAKDYLEPLLTEFRENDILIGSEIGEAVRELRLKSSTLGQCPSCKSGELIIIKNSKTGKRFVGCTGFQKGTCSLTYPLPQTGKIQKTEKTCSTCNAPIIRVTGRGRRPWEFCVNINCSTKKRRKNDEKQMQDM